LAAADLENIMEELGMPRKDAQKLLKSADKDEDGLLNFDEFSNWMYSRSKRASVALARITCGGA